MHKLGTVNLAKRNNIFAMPFCQDKIYYGIILILYFIANKKFFCKNKLVSLCKICYVSPSNAVALSVYIISFVYNKSFAYIFIIKIIASSI